VSASRKLTRQATSGLTSSSVTCYNCKKPGHFSCDCPKPRRADLKKIKEDLEKRALKSGKDSFLGKFKVNFSDVNLSQLIGGLYLTIPCTIAYNRYTVKLNALANSEANGFVFIDTLYAINIAKFLNIKAQRLSCLINVKGYNRKAGSAITHILRLYLTINRRRQYHISLLILDLGSHNCILGRKWFVFLGVLINAKRYCL
jgi:hypothetical protein